MENTSLRGRFSLSSTNLTSPIAESTCLNGSGHSKFNWGEGSISSQSRNNSNTTNKNSTMSKNLNCTPPKVAMSPISRIDPRTFVDIHSNGLASRIVKYHDNSARLNRSLSMGNLYNKPGQFPVVHLKKNELQYKAKKSRNLSMTRIAAPEKSIFHGNTLSSILRSGSIVGLQKSDEEISRENRPILHPPPTENEMAPTRSVLEVLKEISRKRINSDELDGTELIKKYCKEPEYDTVPYNVQKTQSKRQREMSTSGVSNVQISPEQQMVKKRMCNYNNDIMSSLSSSMLSINKKKMLEMQSQKRTASDLAAESISSTGLKDVEPSRSEKQRCVGSFDLENIAQSSKYTPITPLPSTPYQNGSDDTDKHKIGLVTRRASEPVISHTRPKLTLFNKDYDEVTTKEGNDIAESREDGDLCGIQFVKPKKSSSLSSGGTLLMEKTKKSKLALMLSGLKGELNEEDEVDALPKAQQQNEVELTVSVTPTVPTIVPCTQAAISFGTVTKTATIVTPTLDANTKPAAEVSTTTTPAIGKTGLQFNAPTAKTSVSSSTSSEIQLSVATSLSSTSAAPVAVSTPAITTSTPISLATSTAPSIPTLSGFSFGLNKPLTLPTTQTAVVTSQLTVPQVTKAISTSAGTLPSTVPATTAELKPLAFGLTNTPSVTPAPSFTFGAPSSSSLSVPATQAPPVVAAFGTAPTTTTKTIGSAAPVFGQTSAAAQPTFSFGSLAASNTNSTTNSLTIATSTPATAIAPTFNFGAPLKSSWSPSVTQAPTNTNPILSVGSFGSVATSTSAPQSTSTLTSTTTNGGFSFSGSASTVAPKPLFGSMVPATTPSNSNATFSFSANNAPATQTNPTNAFTFGSPAAPSAAPTNQAQTSMFGSATSDKPANSFSFGAPATAPVKTSFSFPSSDKPAVPTTTPSNSTGGFSFNAPVPNALPAPEPKTNIFGNTATAIVPAKPVFSFGTTASNQSTSKPTVFGAPAVQPTNLFGAATTTTVQSSPFAFGSSGTSSNQGAVTAPNINPFGTTATSNQSSGLGASASSTGSIFGAPSAAVAPLQQSSTFTFGASSSNNIAEPNKPAGGFVFGSSSSIGSNASKPVADMNKTFVFGDGSTTITPAAPATPNLFGGNDRTNNSNAGGSDNKMFSFGGAGAGTAGSSITFGGASGGAGSNNTFGGAAAGTAVSNNTFGGAAAGVAGSNNTFGGAVAGTAGTNNTFGGGTTSSAGSNNTFGGNRQTVNQSPVFNFGTAAQSTPAPAQKSISFAPQPTVGAPSTMMGTPEIRPIRKAMRRLHKT